jgi:small subunit ribosomal protein S8
MVPYQEPNQVSQSSGSSRNSLPNSFSRISNAYQRSFEEESIPFSLLNVELITAFLNAGYVSGWDYVAPTEGISSIRVYLKYYQGRPAIRGISQISKPGKRVYLSKKKLLKISETQSWGNTKTLFVGTSQGIWTHRQILSIAPQVPPVDTFGVIDNKSWRSKQRHQVTPKNNPGGEAYCLVW